VIIARRSVSAARDLAKALAELDLKAKTGDRTAIDKFRDDARRAGVPPGWVR
jgi:hypothetical protein